MDFLKIHDGTLWPNIDDRSLTDGLWKARHAPSAITKEELAKMAQVCSAYIELINHPAFTLKVVSQKVSGIRKAIKRQLA